MRAPSNGFPRMTVQLLSWLAVNHSSLIFNSDEQLGLMKEGYTSFSLELMLRNKGQLDMECNICNFQ